MKRRGTTTAPHPTPPHPTDESNGAELKPVAKQANKPRKKRRTSDEIEAVVAAAKQQGYRSQHTGVSWSKGDRRWRAEGPRDPANGSSAAPLVEQLALRIGRIGL